MADQPASDLLMLQRFADMYIIEFLHSRVLDPMQIQQIDEYIGELIARAGLPKLIISFENVQHISSAMIGVLLSVQKRAAKAGGGLRLACVPKPVMEVFRITQLHKTFAIYDTTDKAMVKF